MRKRIGERRRAKLLEDLALAEREVGAIAAEYGMTIVQLADWASRPQNAAALAAVRRLADEHAQTALCNWRCYAVDRLAEIALRDDATKGHDISRRTCVDVLKTELAAPAAAEPPQTATVDTAEIIRRIDAAQPSQPTDGREQDDE